MNTIERKQMTGRTGRGVANQYILISKEGLYFQSYQTIIAFIDNDARVFLDEDNWDYSTTTGKYRNQFLGEKKAETQRKIDNGTYKLKDLNCKDSKWKN